MKIAFVYDRINKVGGAERVLQAFHQLWPKAPFHTAVYNSSTAAWAQDLDIKTSFLQHLPLAKTHHELYPWLTPLAFESFNFDAYDIVISITSAEAKAIITKPKTLHICYCLTPTRYLWSHQHQYQTKPGLGLWTRAGKWVFSRAKNKLQHLDLIASTRPDIYLAISKTVQQRIKKYYHRHSQVIYPPVNTRQFSKISSIRFKPPFSHYYLIVSRLTPYKKVDLAIRACNQLQQPLIIVGVGREQKNLQKLAGSSIKFLGQVNDQKLISLYQGCQALIMPQEEDLGLVAVEAQAAGKPVIAFNRGGAPETIITNKTGLLFNQQTVDSLVQAMKQFNSYSWNTAVIKRQATKFDNKVFKQKITTLVKEQWQQHQQSLQ